MERDAKDYRAGELAAYRSLVIIHRPLIFLSQCQPGAHFSRFWHQTGFRLLIYRRVRLQRRILFIECRRRYRGFDAVCPVEETNFTISYSPSSLAG